MNIIFFSEWNNHFYTHLRMNLFGDVVVLKPHFSSGPFLSLSLSLSFFLLDITISFHKVLKYKNISEEKIRIKDAGVVCGVKNDALMMMLLTTIRCLQL